MPHAPESAVRGFSALFVWLNGLSWRPGRQASNECVCEVRNTHRAAVGVQSSPLIPFLSLLLLILCEEIGHSTP